MSAAPLPLFSQWHENFIKILTDDLQGHDDPLVKRLLADTDTLHLAGEHVRRYLAGFWRGANEDRAVFGAELRRYLPSAIAGQKTTEKILELIAERWTQADQPATAINPIDSLKIARTLLEQLQLIQTNVGDATNVKSLGYAGDLQTLYSLECLLRHRLGGFSYDTMATLLHCGHQVEGKDSDVVDPDNLKKRIAKWCENHRHLAEQTEATVRTIPHAGNYSPNPKSHL